VLSEVIRFEWRYYTRQLSFAAAVVLFFGFGLVLTGTGFGAHNIHINSPYSIFESLGMASLASLFVVAVFCADAVVRDRERQMEELVFTTAIGKFDYLSGRFTGSFLAAFTAFSSCALGMAAALALPNHDPSRIGSVQVAHYAWALLVMVLPTMLVAAVTLFAIATLTRSILATVVGAVFIYVLYFVASALTGSPLMAGASPGANESPLASLLDPFAMSVFFEQTRYWTPLQRNTQLIALSGNFLINRLLWLGIAAVIWTIVYRRFSFRTLRQQRAASKGVALARESNIATTPYRAMTVSTNLRAQLAALRFATMLEIRSSAVTLPFALLTILWSALCATEVLADVTGGEYGSALYPTTALVLATIQQPFTLIATVILVWYAAEVCWRERSSGIVEVVNATPASNGVFVVSKWLALSVLLLVLTIAALATGLLIQISRGYMQFEPLHLLAGAWFMVMPLIVFATAAVIIHAVAPQKYVGMFATLLLAIGLSKSADIGLEHPLWRFSHGPVVPYSAMNGYGHYAAPFAAYMLLWSAGGALLLCASALLWRRAAGDRSRAIVPTLRAATPSLRQVSIALLVLALSTGAFILYQTNVLHTYEPRASVLDWQADYEKSYARFSALAQPAVTAITANVALYPDERRYTVSGSYILANASSAPIARILVAVPRGVVVNTLTMPGALLASRDTRFGAYWFIPVRPLEPGQSTSLTFDLTYSNGGFPGDDDDSSIVANGTYITSQHAFPLLGYRRGYELTDAGERKKRGLVVRNAADDRDGGEVSAGNEWIDFDMTVSTNGDQTAVTPGRLIATSTNRGRRTFHYLAEQKIRNVFAIASARYETASTMAGNVRVELLYDRRHSINVPRMLTAATDSLRLFAQSFGPYPNRELRIVEVPSYAPFAGFANPGVVYLNEERAFLTDARDPARLDIITRRVAHEVAHQWWGHGVAPANREGSSAITESLAKYSELLLLETRYGRDAISQSLARELDLYLSGRTGDERDEVPLARATTQAYIYYRKGSIVLRAIDDLVGRAAFLHALHDFYTAQHGLGHAPTSSDLIAAFHAVATPPQQAQIDEWTSEIVLYDLTLLSAKSQRLSNGQYDVTLQIRAGKLRANGNGSTVPIALHEAIDVALFSSAAGDGASLMFARKVPLHDGLNTLHVVLSAPPRLAAIDPWITRIDRDRFDNERAVE
jgi:ABC-type transport system involved in multi-copper enzyme maturation permease subunit